MGSDERCKEQSRQKRARGQYNPGAFPCQLWFWRGPRTDIAVLAISSASPTRHDHCAELLVLLHGDFDQLAASWLRSCWKVHALSSSVRDLSAFPAFPTELVAVPRK